MKKRLYLLILLLSLSLAAVRAQSSHSGEIAGILSKIPADDAQQFNQNMDEVGALGEAGLQDLATMLKPGGQQDNTKVQYVLNGFAGYVMQPGKDDWRSSCVQAYGHALGKITDPMNQQFLIRQLAIIGRDDAIPFIQPYLQDKMLVHPAAQALATIHTPAAEKTLLAALQQSSAQTRPALVEALGDCRTKTAVSYITPLAKSKDTVLRKLSLYALANIGDPASATLIRRAAQEAGYRFSVDNATSDYLLFVQQLINSGENKVAGKMIGNLIKKTRKDNQKAVHSAALHFQQQLQKPLPVAHNELSQAEKKEGFTLLFDGKDLDHWQGNKQGYLVEDGSIVVNPSHGSGGNLYTEGEYGDFIFRFQFQLTPGANNGIGIRAPLQGDAAYVGMEIQVLDNTADIYKDLHPYQYHGSVYGVIPAKRGYLKPVGEWNEEEIRAEGPKIKVTLNGHVIVDGDIDQASINGTADHKQHPGLKNSRGHIGFLGHGSVVRFRDIRVKSLDQPAR